MKTKINFSREAGCSRFLSIFTCLFRGTGLTNRNFTHLVKVLGPHQGVGPAISQTSISYSPVVLALWDLRMKSCSWHSCSSTELKENLSPESLPWSLNSTACHDMAATGGEEGIAGRRLCGLQNTSAQPFLSSMSNVCGASTWCCQSSSTPAPYPFHPEERQVWLLMLTISMNHEVKCLMLRFRAC